VRRGMNSLVRRINRTNPSSRLGAGTLADALAERDVLKIRHTAHRELAAAASTAQARTTRARPDGQKIAGVPTQRMRKLRLLPLDI
jgi:hypothetical protein